jgi:hypothetical protein
MIHPGPRARPWIVSSDARRAEASWPANRPSAQLPRPSRRPERTVRASEAGHGDGPVEGRCHGPPCAFAFVGASFRGCCVSCHHLGADFTGRIATAAVTGRAQEIRNGDGTTGGMLMSGATPKRGFAGLQVARLNAADDLNEAAPAWRNAGWGECSDALLVYQAALGCEEAAARRLELRQRAPSPGSQPDRPRSLPPHL